MVYGSDGSGRCDPDPLLVAKVYLVTARTSRFPTWGRFLFVPFIRHRLSLSARFAPSPRTFPSALSNLHISRLWKTTFAMSSRKPSIIINDILTCIDHIELYTSALSFDEFSSNFMVIEACGKM